MVKKGIDFKQNNWLYLSIVAVVAIVAIMVISTGVNKLSLASDKATITDESDLTGEASRKTAAFNLSASSSCYIVGTECYSDVKSNSPKDFVGCVYISSTNSCKDVCGKSWDDSYFCSTKYKLI